MEKIVKNDGKIFKIDLYFYRILKVIRSEH